MVWILAAGAYAGPPATVVEHRIEVVVDSGLRLSETQTWTVRVDDPTALAAGVLAPPGLDGAADRGAVVLEDLLLVPADTPPGTVYTLSQQRTEGRGAHSGLFVTAPELPVDHAEIVVEAPTGTPLGVWADPSATPTWSSRSARRVTMAWDDLVPGDRGNAAWSTHTDWIAASAGTVESVERLLASQVELGRDIGASLEGLGVAGLAEKTFDLVALEDGPPGTWADARPAKEVIASASGTAAERGVVLLSLLDVAGIDAVPGWFRPASAPGAFPITIPAPVLLPRPLVVVRRPDGDVLVDPAADRAAIPELPASLVGATVWVAGEMPSRLPATGVADGMVAISTTLSIAVEGAATWNVAIQATGPAQEVLRNLLHPLDEAGRTEAFTRLLRQARPDLTRIQTSVTGADKASRKLKITVSGHDPNVFTAAGYGLRGTVAPALAPALAGWLPPHLTIVETVAIEPPPSMQILGTTVAPSLYRPEALVTRSAMREGHDVVMTVEVERPYRRTTPGRDAAAAAFLESEAPKGIELLLFTEASGTAMKALRAESSLSPAERAVLEALVWWNNDSARKAEKVLARAEAQLGTTAVLAELGRMANRGDHRPWLALDEVVEEDPASRIEVVEAMEEIGARREAWDRAAILAESPDPDVAVRALLAVHRLQGPTPDPGADAPEWVPPIELVLRAEERAKEIDDSHPDPRVVYPLAALRLEVGDVASAEALLESVPHGERAALADALLALAAAQGGVPVAEVNQRIDQAVAADPFDPEVVGTAAEAAARVGDVRQAQRLAVTAARLAHGDPDRWTRAVPLSLAAGDLATAADAAREASRLDPHSPARASTWELMATLMLDRPAVDEARVRAGLTPIEKWPPTIDERIGLAPEAALLALLQYADAEVIADARLLAMRTQLRIDAGLLDDAARDGVLLATRHQDPEGHALAFAATAGRQYSTTAIAALDKAARTDPTAQTTRMEYRLIAGTGDPVEDARRLGDDPRGEALTLTIVRPSSAATAMQGWPATLPKSSRAPIPSGYRSNRALSAVPGVVGYSHPEAARAIVRVPTVTGLVPPPVGLLYTANPQVLERLPDGGQVIRLEGGVIPLYAAVTIDGAEEVYGFAFTVEGAKRALADALAD